MISIEIASVITGIINCIVRVWNFLDTIVIRADIIGFTVLQLLVAIYVVGWLIYLFFLGSEKAGDE